MSRAAAGGGPARITVITAGQPSTCPRMLKAADALALAGYDVRLVCTRFLDWASAADLTVLRAARWRPAVVDYSRSTAPWRSRWVGARRRLAARVVENQGVDRASWWAVTRAFSYVHPELVAAALAEPADFFYGGTTGALAAVAEAASRAGRPYSLDLEDFHSAESTAPDAALQHALARRVESQVLSGAAMLTTSSQAIARAYGEKQGVDPVVIHNVAILPAQEPRLEVGVGPLRCYWFSQTIGPGRGLEEFIDAVRVAGVGVTLHLRGRVGSAFADRLTQRASLVPNLRLELLPPAPPDTMVALATAYDIGLCLELPLALNRDVSASNKLFTYLAAGLALIATTTAGQTQVGSTIGDGVAWWTPADGVASLARIIERWHEDRRGLLAAKHASWRAAQCRWRWDHPLEGPRLVALIAAALP